MFIFIVLFISYYYFFKMLKKFSCSGMFRDVPECSGMFHVPGFIDAHGGAREEENFGTNSRISC